MGQSSPKISLSSHKLQLSKRHYTILHFLNVSFYLADIKYFLFFSTADFGDFNRYDSQEFLQKFVLFPIVSILYSIIVPNAIVLYSFVFDTNHQLCLSLQDWIQDERVLEEATQKVALLYQSFRWADVLCDTADQKSSSPFIYV